MKYAERLFRIVAGLIAESLCRATNMDLCHEILNIVKDFEYGFICVNQSDKVFYLFFNYFSLYLK